MNELQTRTAASLPGPAIDRLQAALAASMAPATRRAYRGAWTAWADWARASKVDPLPAAPEAVAAYLAGRADGGAGMATLRLACAAIKAAHEIAEHESPTASKIVRQAMAGLSRQAAEAGQSTKQAAGLTAEAVASIRGSLNGRADKDRMAARDMAIVSLVADAGLRRSEAAALAWTDIAREPDGSGRATIRRSKTDQHAEGAVVAITRAAMADLDRHQAFQAASGIDFEGSVFGLSDRQIARRIALLAKAAGLGEGYSGHSGRVGMAQRMTKNGAPAAAVMRQGRWSSSRMVAAYTRKQAAGEALRYLEG